MNEKTISVSPFSSLLGRLQSRPDKVLSSSASLGMHFNVIKKEIQDDLENLLNTRLRQPHGIKSYSTLEKSSLNYGLPDFTQYVFKNSDHQEDFKRDVIRVIQTFEPRLHDVKVYLQPYDEDKPQQLKMTIEANYYLSAQLVAFTFNSDFDSSTQLISVYEGYHYG